MSLDTKLVRVKELLGQIERQFAPAALASSFGAEDMVLTHLIATEFPGIQIFTLDTGRLPAETIALMHDAQARYDVTFAVYRPQAAVVEAYVKEHGANAFYESVDLRKACCGIRKVEPLSRALAGKKAWLTGLRREQAASRRDLGEQEFDADHGLTKFNPLIEWTNDDVWAFIRANDIPYNALHDRGYPSIGCEPCTRAVKQGEDPRAGRWWWENAASGQQECGLHVAHNDSQSTLSTIRIQVTA